MLGTPKGITSKAMDTANPYAIYTRTLNVNGRGGDRY